ncbi:mitochondrial carrier domain-containing protein [Lipomyces oligophaga]|uniref:mitochondrial carrier domain-containing protein n=1 Tax=Lipomyces oligophaga TaxID=45792 RepID=UPI0034CEE27A
MNTVSLCRSNLNDRVKEEKTAMNFNPYSEEGGSVYRLAFASTFAGVAEVALTYPLEYLKIRSQLPEELNKELGLIRRKFRLLYTGCGTMMFGSVARSGARIATFEILRQQLSDPETGGLTPPTSLAAGLAAGLIESLVLVPFELVKVRQISSLKVPPPGTRETFGRINYLHGPLGYTYGLMPTLIRQGVASATRFTAYNSLRQLAEGFVPPGERMSSNWSGLLELFSVYAAVLITMPIDVVKTRMETLSGRQLAKSRSTLCMYQLFMTDGVLSLFNGVFPRIIRASVATVIMYPLYRNGLAIADFIAGKPDLR